MHVSAFLVAGVSHESPPRGRAAGGRTEVWRRVVRDRETDGLYAADIVNAADPYRPRRDDRTGYLSVRPLLQKHCRPTIAPPALFAGGGVSLTYAVEACVPCVYSPCMHSGNLTERLVWRHRAPDCRRFGRSSGLRRAVSKPDPNSGRHGRAGG